MKANPLTLICVAAALVGGSALNCWASDPVGIYAFVDKVVFEPNETAPERIQVWGGFALAEGSGEKYAAAARGYVYCKLKEGKETLCRNEWNDLKSVAGTAQVVSFGTRYGDKVTVRKADSKPEKPDVYPTGWGMQKPKRSDYGPVADLLALRDGKTTAPKEAKPASK